MIVFGGLGVGDVPLNDIWELSLSGTPTWRQLTPTTVGPLARGLFASAYDPDSSRFLIHGGFPGYDPRLNDTWALSLTDPPTWQRIVPTGQLPPPAQGKVGAFDPVTRSMLVYGGLAPSHIIGDVWRLGNNLDPRPILSRVIDVPNDQGGRVVLHWTASDFDRPGLRTISGYRVWRRSIVPSTQPSHEIMAAIPTELATDFWEAIGEFPAASLQGYAFAAPTLVDSTALGNPLTAFAIQATTPDQFVYYFSNIDSGYSVDNLAPLAPASFVARRGPGTSVLLSWKQNREADVAAYFVHRGDSPAFVPGPSNLIAVSQDTTASDPQPGMLAPHYKVAARDIHGNLGAFALAFPDAPVSTLLSLVSSDVSPGRVRLFWYGGDVASKLFTVERRTTDDWTVLGTVHADAKGHVTFEDASVEAGQAGYRLSDGGVAVTPETWVTVPKFGLAIEGLSPNPAAERISLAITTADRQDVEMEVFDVRGRRVAHRSMSTPTPGRHLVELQEVAHLAPGVYLLRVSAGDQSAIRRFLVAR